MLRVKNIENTHFIVNGAVGVKFTIEELDYFNSIQENKEITEMIAAHMNQQRRKQSLPRPWFHLWVSVKRMLGSLS